MNTRHIRLAILLSIVLACTMGSTLFAQGIQSSTSGFSIKGGPVWETWSSSSYYLGDVDGESFLGVSLAAAYGFGQRLEGFTGYQVAWGYTPDDYSTYRNRTFTLGIRSHFGGTLHKVRPWISAAFCWQTLLLKPISYYDDFGNYLGEFSLGAKGAGLAAGFGLKYFITPVLALDLGLNGRFGNFSTIRIDGTIDDTGETVDFRFYGLGLGLCYYMD